MTVRVELFAAARELAGESWICVDLPSESCVGDLREKVVADFPCLEDVVKSSLFSINQEYASDETVVSEGLEIALIPPVSGG